MRFLSLVDDDSVKRRKTSKTGKKNDGTSRSVGGTGRKRKITYTEKSLVIRMIITKLFGETVPIKC